MSRFKKGDPVIVTDFSSHWDLQEGVVVKVNDPTQPFKYSVKMDYSGRVFSFKGRELSPLKTLALDVTP